MGVCEAAEQSDSLPAVTKASECLSCHFFFMTVKHGSVTRLFGGTTTTGPPIQPWLRHKKQQSNLVCAANVFLSCLFFFFPFHCAPRCRVRQGQSK